MPTQRLPTPGQDDGTWGIILNEYLGVEHNADGTLKNTGSIATKADDSEVVHNSRSEIVAGTKTFSSSPNVPTPTLGSQVANKGYVDTTITATSPVQSVAGRTGAIVLTPGDSGALPAPTTAIPIWSASTSYPTIGQLVSKNGYLWANKIVHISGTTFTGAANWVQLAPVLGTTDGSAPAPLSVTGKNPLTGMWHASSYGAKGDNTTDDAPAINAAILACSTAGGGRVFIQGAGVVSSSITPRSGVTLYGNSPADTSLRHTANSNIIYGQTVAFTNFAIDGITFLGPVNEFPTSPKRARTTSGAGGQTAVFLDGDLNTVGTGQAALDGFKMTRCVVKNMTALPILLKGIRGKVVILGNEFINNQDVGFTFCQEVIFNNNHVSMSADNGVSLSRGCAKVTCTGNTFENCCYHGIWASGFSTDLGPTDFTITGNIVRNVGFNGVMCDTAPAYGTITGNSLYGGYFRGASDQASDINGAGVYIGGYPATRTSQTNLATGIAVVGNSIHCFARAGIYLNGVKDITILGNQILDIGTQFLSDGTTAILSTDAMQNVGILMENSATSSTVVVALNSVKDNRATQYCNYGLVPQQVSAINAYLNHMAGCRNGFNMYETGPQRTHAEINLWNAGQKFVGGAIAGTNGGAGTITGFDVNGASGSIRPYRWLTGGSNRWQARANGTAESGSNVGSDLEFAAYDDTAVALTTPLILTRRGSVSVGVTGQAVMINGHRASAASAVSITVGTTTTAAAAASNGANDSSGYITATASGTPSAASIAVITYANAYASIPKATLTPRNAATAACGLYVTAETTTGFTVAASVTPAAAALLSFGYHVEG